MRLKCKEVQGMTSDNNELAVKTEENIVLFDLKTGEQIWNLPWDINSNYPTSSNKIKQDIHIWKTEVFWYHDEESPKDMCRYSKFQLIRLIFEQELKFLIIKFSIDEDQEGLIIRDFANSIIKEKVELE